MAAVLAAQRRTHTSVPSDRRYLRIAAEPRALGRLLDRRLSAGAGRICWSARCSLRRLQLRNTRRNKFAWDKEVTPTILCTHLSEAEQINKRLGHRSPSRRMIDRRRSRMSALTTPVRHFASVDNPSTSHAVEHLNRACIASNAVRDVAPPAWHHPRHSWSCGLDAW